MREKMKVVCRKCKKMYDYDTYMGICPGCGQYYSMSSSYDTTSGSHTTNNKATGSKATATSRTNKTGMPGFVKAIIIIIVLFNFGIPILGVIFSIVGEVIESDQGSINEIADVFEEEAFNGFETVTTESDEKIITYGINGEEWNVQLYDMEYEEELSSFLLEDMEIVSFAYDVYDSEWNLVDRNTPVSAKTQIYVHLDDGSSQEPESREFIEKLMLELNYTPEEVEYDFGVSDNFVYPTGRLYFCVRPDSIQGIQVEVINEEGTLECYYFDAIY